MTEVPTPQADTRQWYITILERFGFPTFACVVLVYLLYSSVAWTGENVLLPLAQGHLKFMQVTEELSRKQSENMAQVLKTQETLSRQQAELAENNKEIVRTLEALAKKIEKP